MPRPHLALVLISAVFTTIKSGYTPSGDEVQPGSVLLPASRRGRYLANIVRRQAVDGTGIKFNKDADRMNAEAKKKVDVLSEELLPYIIAEQERRITLHKRVMVAIQNGERGVTIAEIRNRPPIFIKRGQYFRCPSNRQPMEPDGSGGIMCSQNVTPSQVLYDSCLHSEDAALYVIEKNKYFYCNRHKEFVADLPRNDTHTFGCHPRERTSYNYTVSSCTLEETDDIVVHYRYYPDRTYKYVSEIDPDREVCEHWNPCQIGYIFSISSLEEAQPATDFFQFVEEDLKTEHVPRSLIGAPYRTSPFRFQIPEGTDFSGAVMVTRNGKEITLGKEEFEMSEPKTAKGQPSGRRCLGCLFAAISFVFSDVSEAVFGATFYCIFEKPGSHEFVREAIITIEASTVEVSAVSIVGMIGQHVKETPLEMSCARCRVLRVIHRSCAGAADGQIDMRSCEHRVTNLKPSDYVLEESRGKKHITLNISRVDRRYFGDYFAIVRNKEGEEEKVKIASVEDNAISIKDERISAEHGLPVSRYINYTCAECDVTDITCNGESVINTPEFRLLSSEKLISFNFRYEDRFSCAYIAYFTIRARSYYKVIFVIDNVAVPPPAGKVPVKVGDKIEKEFSYRCERECRVATVTCNGLQTDKVKPKGSSALELSIEEVTPADVGVYQAVFEVADKRVTKTLAELSVTKETDKATAAGEVAPGEAAAAPGEAAGATGEAAGTGDEAAAATDAPP